MVIGLDSRFIDLEVIWRVRAIDKKPESERVSMALDKVDWEEAAGTENREKMMTVRESSKFAIGEKNLVICWGFCQGFILFRVYDL